MFVAYVPILRSVVHNWEIENLSQSIIVDMEDSQMAVFSLMHAAHQMSKEEHNQHRAALAVSKWSLKAGQNEFHNHPSFAFKPWTFSYR